MAGTRRRWRLPVLALPSIELSIRAASRRGMLGARGAAFAWNWRAGRLAGRKLGTTARDKDSEKSMSSLSKLSFFRRFAALHVVAAPLLGQGIPLQDWYAYPDRHSEWRWFSARLLARDPEPIKPGCSADHAGSAARTRRQSWQPVDTRMRSKACCW